MSRWTGWLWERSWRETGLVADGGQVFLQQQAHEQGTPLEAGEAIHAPDHVADQQELVPVLQAQVDHLAAGGMPGGFDQHQAGSDRWYWS